MRHAVALVYKERLPSGKQATVVACSCGKRFSSLHGEAPARSRQQAHAEEMEQ